MLLVNNESENQGETNARGQINVQVNFPNANPQVITRLVLR